MKNYRLDLLSHEKVGQGHYACNDTCSRDGQVYIPVSGGEPFALYTPDLGKTWEKTPLPGRRGGDRFIQLKDGSFYAVNFANAVLRSVRDYNQDPLPFIAAIYRADSMDDIRAGRIRTQFVPVEIPRLTVGYGDSNNVHSGCAGNVIEMSNGDILVTMYGQWKDDVTLCPYFREYGKYDFYLYRTWCLISHDGGNSFELLTSIADVQTYPIADINAEGYCEPWAMEVEPGHIVCILRTGGHEVYSPMYCTHSFDYGKTWEPPYEICGWGVLPKLLMLSDGTLMCVSGHIHTMLLFSDDLGRTWSDPYILEPCDGKWDRSPSGYNSAFESAPGEITVIYDDPKEGIAKNVEGLRRNVYIRKYRFRAE